MSSPRPSKAEKRPHCIELLGRVRDDDAWMKDGNL